MNGHGGKREGAGRKRILTDDQRAWVASEWHLRRQAIVAAKGSFHRARLPLLQAIANDASEQFNASVTPREVKACLENR